MNNYYLLIYLKRALIKKILHGTFYFAISPHENVLEIYIKNNGSTYRLIAGSDPRETALFLDDYRPPKKRNVLNFFTELEGAYIDDITLAKYDRLLTLHFDNGYQLLFKLYGHDVNILLTRDDTIKDSFKHPQTVEGKQAPQPQQPTFAETVNQKAKPKNQITKLNPLLPRNLLKPLIQQHKVDKMEPHEVKTFTDEITQAMQHDPHPRVLENGKITLWDESLLALPTEKSFNSVNNAIRYAYRNAVHLRRLHAKKEQINRFLTRWLKKKKATYSQLLQADKSLERADKYEKYGNLLMTKAHESLPKGLDVLTLDDIYKANEPIDIPVDDDQSIAQNAEAYYQKAQASKKSYQTAKKRIPAVRDNIEQTEQLLNELQSIDRLPTLNKWTKEKRKAIRERGVGEDQKDQSTSPFRKFKVGKYEIWIGKNAKSNDKLIARAHKEDIWLHARGVGGAHALIRMGNTQEYPPKKVTLKAAAYAAYYSKAKGMKIAPVIVTKRKYVYKPKGAVPGQVAVNREEVEMVPPTKP